jgi:hypothetical protein
MRNYSIRVALYVVVMRVRNEPVAFIRATARTRAYVGTRMRARARARTRTPAYTSKSAKLAPVLHYSCFRTHSKVTTRNCYHPGAPPLVAAPSSCSQAVGRGGLHANVCERLSPVTTREASPEAEREFLLIMRIYNSAGRARTRAYHTCARTRTRARTSFARARARELSIFLDLRATDDYVVLHICARAGALCNAYCIYAALSASYFY